MSEFNVFLVRERDTAVLSFIKAQPLCVCWYFVLLVFSAETGEADFIKSKIEIIVVHGYYQKINPRGQP